MARLREVRPAWLVSTVISENTPIYVGDELKWLLKVGDGYISRVVVFLLKIYPPFLQREREREKHPLQ